MSNLNEMLELRDYQNDCLTAVFHEFNAGTKRQAVVLPTGSGKTVIFSHLGAMWHWNATRPAHIRTLCTGRMLLLVHTEELISQAVGKFRMVAPALKVGVVQADRDEHAGADIVVGSVQTLRKLPRLDRLRSSGPLGLVVVDECHHAAAGSYVTILTELGCFDPDAPTRAVGFTATLARADKKSLGDVWETVSFQRDILDMINAGWLCDVRGRLVTVDGLSLAQVATSGGDYQVRSLSDALLSSDAPEFVSKAYVEHAGDKSGVVFTPTVDTALRFAEALSRYGIVARPVWGSMKGGEPLWDDITSMTRQDTIAAAHNGHIQVLVNCMVLTEGFDWPAAEVAVIARPTMSAALYVQMTGRVLRIFPNKKRALILDVVGASEEHRLATLADLTSQRIKQVQLGESLAEAARREKRDRNPLLRDYVVSYRDIELFNNRTTLWKRTYEGVWFVSLENTLYFLWPGKGGLYNVGMRRVDAKGGTFVHKDVTMGVAMGWVEAEVATQDPLGTYTSSKASWRKNNDPATDAQKIKAIRIGLRKKVEDNPTISKRDLSDAIEVHVASRVLDWAVKKGRR